MVQFSMFESFIREPDVIVRHFRQASKKRTSKSAFPRPLQPGGSPLAFPLFPQRVNMRPTHERPQLQSAHRFTSYFPVYPGNLPITFLWSLDIFPALFPPALFALPLEGPLSTILFRIRTYEKLAHNSLRMNTSKTQHLKSFRIRTYKKTGRGVRKNKTFHPVCQPSSLFRLTRTHGIPLAARLDYNARRMLMEEPCVWIKWKFPGTAKNPIG
jgi:hypothetical protein